MSEERQEHTGQEGLPEAEFEALMQTVSKAAPLLGGLLPLLSSPEQQESEGKPIDRRASRSALLCALKPYLSPERAAAVDYLLRLAKIGELLSNFK